MLKICTEIKLFLNIKRCTFATPIELLLGISICKKGTKVNLAKVKVMIKLKHPKNLKHIRMFLGQIIILLDLER